MGHALPDGGHTDEGADCLGRPGPAADRKQKSRGGVGHLRGRRFLFFYIAHTGLADLTETYFGMQLLGLIRMYGRSVYVQ